MYICIKSYECSVYIYIHTYIHIYIYIEVCICIYTVYVYIYIYTYYTVLYMRGWIKAGNTNILDSSTYTTL